MYMHVKDLYKNMRILLVLVLQADNMIINTCVDHFHLMRCKDTDKIMHCTGDSKAIPHIISSHIEHPAVNVLLEHLQKTGRAGMFYVSLSAYIHPYVTDNSLMGEALENVVQDTERNWFPHVFFLGILIIICLCKAPFHKISV